MSIHSNYRTSQLSVATNGEEMDTLPDRAKRNSTDVENESRKKIRPNETFKSICDQNEPFDLSEYFEYLRTSPNNNQAILPSFSKSPFLSLPRPTLHQVLQNHKETFSDYEALLDSNSKARLTPIANSPTAYEGREGARRIEYRLRNIGYGQFTTLLNDKGEITISDGSFEKGLLEWAKAHGSNHGNNMDAVEKIKTAYYSNATELDLSDFYLENLPKEIGKLSNLKHLNLRNNEFLYFPKEILDLSNLETLNVSGNGFTELPSDIDKLSKLTHLDLSGNKLTHLPPTIGFLPKLVKLYLNRNHITELPSEMKNLSQLRILDIGGLPLSNKNSLPTWIQELTLLKKLSANGIGLETFPIEVCSLPHLIDLDLSQNFIVNLPQELENASRLKHLCLNANRIKNLPPELSNLIQLRTLEVLGNQIRSIPPEFGVLQNLEQLDVEDNPHLSSLPLTLGNCRNLTQISTDGTRIREDERDAILDTCRALRDADVLTALPLRLAAWKAASGKEFRLDFIHELEERQRQDISEWLLRLERTEEFNSRYRKDLVKAACGILQSLNEIPSFKEDFFVQVPVNNTNCEDRAGMAFNEIYLVWKLATLPEDASEKEKLKLMTQAGKTLAFRKALGNLMAGRTGLAEGVHIYLYYEVKLQEPFDLLTAMKSMSYDDDLGKRDWIDNSIGTLKEKVETEFLNEMLDFKPLEKMLKNDSDFATKWSQSEKEFNARLEKIENGMLDENALLTQMNQAAKDLKASNKELVKTTTEGKLRQHGLLNIIGIIS